MHTYIHTNIYICLVYIHAYISARLKRLVNLIQMLSDHKINKFKVKGIVCQLSGNKSGDK